MTHSQVYGTEKLRKTLFFDGECCVGARVENLLAGSSRTLPTDKSLIVWSETPLGKRHVFDCSLAPVTADA